MCAVLLPPGVNPIAVNKYINNIHILRLTQLYNTLLLFHYWLLVSASMDHHQGNIYQKKNLKMLVHIVEKRKFFFWDPIYIN